MLNQKREQIQSVIDIIDSILGNTLNPNVSDEDTIPFDDDVYREVEIILDDTIAQLRNTINLLDHNMLGE